MIKIEMMDTDKGYSLAASGHAGYAPAGQDIVCGGFCAGADAGKQGRSCCKEWKTPDELCAAWRDFCGAGPAETRPEQSDGRKLV